MKVIKYLGISLLVLLVLIGAFLIWFTASYPDVDPPQTITVEHSPEQLQRGEYLANHVTVCMDCHSKRDWSKYSGPMVSGTEGMGGDFFNEQLGGVPGTIYASNITPAGISHYTDGELIRAFTQGVTKDDRALFPLMPYTSYNKLTESDAASLVTYIRSLKPIENAVAISTLNFPMNLIVNIIPPKSYTPSPEPDTSNSIEYGRYLTTIAACGDCHTPAVEGKPIEGKDFAGGFQFQLPGGVLQSANITPDNKTGIGAWTKQQFINRFKSFESDSAQNIKVAGMYDFNTVMPWTMYSGMTEKDLGAIYDYLRTLKPVDNYINRWDNSKQLPGMALPK